MKARRHNTQSESMLIDMMGAKIQYYKKEDLVIFYDFDHHDNIYKK
jgi:hypothetical protein